MYPGIFNRILVLLFAVGWSQRAAADDSRPAAPVTATGPVVSVTPDLAGRIKHPFNWLEWGFDLRLREEYVHNAATLQSGLPLSTSDYLRIRPRIWTFITPVTNLTLATRLISEPRYYFEPAALKGWQNAEGLFDQMYVRLDRVFNQPLTATVGRQDYIFGNKWLIWDGTPTDGSRTEFFDAGRFTFNWKDQHTTLDAIGFSINSESDAWLPVINNQHRPLSEQDENGLVLYLANTSLARTRLETYFILRDETKVLVNGDSGTQYIFGGRVAGQFAQQWEYRAEFAPQLGTKNGQSLQAFGFNSQIAFNAGTSWKHQFRTGYEYLSGDDPNTATDEGWDPVWGRRAQWSELLVTTFGVENKARQGYWSNLQRVFAGWSAQPDSRVELIANYMPLFANTNPQAGHPGYSDNGKFRGQLAQGIVRFTFNPHLSGHLWGELFWPGDYYSPDRRDMATFLRAEIMYRF
jgi:hypothetical protein